MKLLPFALLFIATACSFQQDPELIAPDSKEAAHELIAKSQGIAGTSISDALDISTAAISIIEANNIEELKAVAYNNYGYLLDKSGQEAKAMDYFTSALSSEIIDEEQEAYSHLRIGMLMVDAGFPQKAIVEYEKSASIYNKLELKNDLYKALFRLSTAYSLAGDRKLRASTISNAIDLSIQSLSKSEQVESRLRLAYYQITQNEIQPAKQNLSELGVLNLKSGSEEALRLLFFQSQIAEKEGRIEEAAAYYQRMQEGLDPVTHQQLYPYAMSRHAAFLQQQGEDAQALKLLQKALPQINAQAVDFEPLESIYHQLEALSFAAGMTKEARDYQHQLFQLTKARQEEQNNLASQYEKAQMLASYQQHQAAQTQREAQARQELIINLIWVGILSIVLSIFGFFLHRYLRLQKRYRSVRTRLDNIGIALKGATGMRVE